MDRSALKHAWIVFAVAIASATGPAKAGPYVRDGGSPAQARHYVVQSQYAQGAPAQAPPQELGPRVQAPVTFLQMNDVYTMVPIDGLGGLARVATQKQQLAAAGRRLSLMFNSFNSSQPCCEQIV